MAGAGRTIRVVAVTRSGEEVQVSNYKEIVIAVLDEMMPKVLERAQKYAPVGDRHKYEAREGPFKSSMRITKAEQDQDDPDFISAGIASASGHAATLEYGSGMFHTREWRSRSQKYKAHRPYTSGRANLRVVPGGEYLIAGMRPLPLPLELFKTPPTGMDAGDIYRRSHDRHGRPYISYATGLPIIFANWAMNPGQEAQPSMRRAMREMTGGIRSKLRSRLAAEMKMKFADVLVTFEVA